MKTNIKPENRRLLDAFYYIDEEVLSDVLSDIRVPDTAPETSKSRAFMRSLRYAAVIAACALLLGAIFPVVMNLIAYFGEGTSTDSPASIPGAPDYLKYSEYVITKDDLDAINAAWKANIGHILAETVDEAMERTRNGNHYFGKYGDTFVFWRSSFYEGDGIKMHIKFMGNDYFFSPGTMWCVSGSQVYSLGDAAGSFGQSEADALYEYYSEEYLYYNDDWNDYSYPMFVPDLEYLSKKTMAKINEDYYAWKYRELYEEYFRGVEPSEIPEVDPVASAYAFKQLGDNKYRFFNPKKCDLYQYYGKFGDCVMLAVENAFYVLQTISVADYTFELGGTGGLYVWRDGEIMHIGEAFEAGYLTVEDIGKAYERYLAYQEYLEGYTPTLSTYVIPEYTPPEHTTDVVYWAFIPGTLSREEMLDIRRAYAKYVFTHTYMSTYENHIMNDWSKEDAEKSAFSNAKSYADRAFVKFFRNNNISERCYGKVGNTVVLAVADPRLGEFHYPLANTSIEFEFATDLLLYNGEDVFAYDEYIYLLNTEEKVTIATRHEIYEARIEFEVTDVEAKATAPTPIGNTDLVPYFGADYMNDPYCEPVNYYGIWGDCMVIGRTFGAPYNMSTLVGAYEFYYPENYMITVGCGGDVYDLSVAYHLGLIDDYELAEIYAMFNLYDRAVRQVNKEW